ncbi:hypothetical protein [Planctopirus hydrillae]|uniref:hypothetical protein n=1 Tax=Planctopirus hydrillae TaxID=1841610 RepID=UPI0010422060|nr:hypothetical protein [Planctopirus hydrillae]
MSAQKLMVRCVNAVIAWILICSLPVATAEESSPPRRVVIGACNSTIHTLATINDWLLVGSESGRISAWSLNDRRCLKTYNLPDAHSTCSAMFPSRDEAVLGLSDGKIAIASLPELHFHWMVTNHKSPVIRVLTVSANCFVTLSLDGDLQVFRRQESGQWNSKSTRISQASCFAMAEKDSLLCGTIDGSLLELSLADLKTTPVTSYKARSTGFVDLCQLKNGDFISSEAGDGGAGWVREFNKSSTSDKVFLGNIAPLFFQEQSTRQVFATSALLDRSGVIMVRGQEGDFSWKCFDDLVIPVTCMTFIPNRQERPRVIAGTVNGFVIITDGVVSK